jgi:hypothetical protein
MEIVKKGICKTVTTTPVISNELCKKKMKFGIPDIKVRNENLVWI